MQKGICKICGREYWIRQSREETSKYCSRKCNGMAHRGKTAWNQGTKGIMKAWNKDKKCPQLSRENNGAWKGGRKIASGYVLIHCPAHPHAAKAGYVREHRLVMEKLIGRLLKSEEAIHHINGDKTDNRPKNLMLFKTHGTHTNYHRNHPMKEGDIVFDGSATLWRKV